jgi:hypothetical protein
VGAIVIGNDGKKIKNRVGKVQGSDGWYGLGYVEGFPMPVTVFGKSAMEAYSNLLSTICMVKSMVADLTQAGYPWFRVIELVNKCYFENMNSISLTAIETERMRTFNYPESLPKAMVRNESY